MGFGEIEDVPLYSKTALMLLFTYSSSVDIHLLYTNNDIWAPLKDMNVIKSILPELKRTNTTIEYIPNLSHSFVMDADSVEVVIRNVISNLFVST